MAASTTYVPDLRVGSNKLDSAAHSDTSKSIHSVSPEEDRKAFLASYSAEEDKEIRRKVDRRFLWLIGLIYILKNVSYPTPTTFEDSEETQSHLQYRSTTKMQPLSRCCKSDSRPISWCSSG